MKPVSATDVTGTGLPYMYGGVHEWDGALHMF